ncbi:VOC family protein [Sphingomonas azotifigens]|uniref:VOC family protein n=1 Tax=Sphingomonas azotifigens TaxID=330920 RepID=UPI000A038E74|nr:VOC family protein [Sphingomonas azotifigens]
MSSNTLGITPFMHVRHCKEAVAFLVERLGFTAIIDDGGYAYLEREGVAIRILGHEKDDAPIEGHGGFAYYIDVADVDVVVQQLGPKLAGLPPEHVRGPVDQDYGQRELIIRVPDGNLLVFCQARSRIPA